VNQCKVDDNTYRLPQGESVSSFFAATGPAHVIEYNLLKVRSPEEAHRIYVNIHHEHTPTGKRILNIHSYGDTVTLTELGERLLKSDPDRVVYCLKLACSGKANRGFKGVDQTNCQRACGKLGPEPCGCPNQNSKYHLCNLRIEVLRTIRDVHEFMVQVKIIGNHVPSNVVRAPPSLSALKTDASVGSKLANLVAHGTITPAIAVNTVIQQAHQRALSTDGSTGTIPTNTRFLPSINQISNQAKHVRRKFSLPHNQGDWEASNDLVRKQLLDKNMCLYFERLPGIDSNGLVVLSSPFALRLLRDHCGRSILCTDCKEDTSGGNAKYSTIRIATPKGWMTVCVWICQGENTQSILRAMDSLERSVPCLDDGNCDHWKGSWMHQVGRGNIFRLETTCFHRQNIIQRLRDTPVAIDKHAPSISAVLLSCFKHSLFDSFHVHRAASKYFDEKIGNLTEAAKHCLEWAFRLWRRSDSEETADQMYEFFVQAGTVHIKDTLLYKCCALTIYS
jgi:hypothetical protein